MIVAPKTEKYLRHHRMTILVSASLCIFIVLPLPGQEKKEATKKDVDLQQVQTPSTDAPLPKIDLPEFVITGSEKIDLNIDSKSEEDEERIFSPARPTPGERPLSTGESLTPKQVKSFVKTPGALNGKVFGGYGFYGTPQFDGWFGQYNPAGSIVMNGYYSESGGHVADAGFWRGGFGLRGSYAISDSSLWIPSGQLRGEVKYGRDAYRAFSSRTPFRVRDLSALEVSGGIGSRHSLPYKSITGVDYSLTAGWGNFSATDSAKSSETDFFVNGVAATRFFETSLRSSLDYHLLGYSMNLPNLHSGHWFEFRLDGKYLLVPSVQLSFAVQQYLYRGNVGVTSGRLYPTLDLRYAVTEDASVYFGIAPVVERNTLSSLVKQNRYLKVYAHILPTDTKFHYYMGIEALPAENLTLSVKLAYKMINNYPIFYDRDSAKVWEVLYLSGIRSTKVDLSATLRLNPEQNVTAYFSSHMVKQKDSSGTLPNIPKFSIGSVYHRFFEFGLHAEAFLEFHASRYTNFSNAHSNAGFVSSGMKAEMELFRQFRGYAELNNMLNQRYYLWNGYLERTVYLLVGISYQW